MMKTLLFESKKLPRNLLFFTVLLLALLITAWTRAEQATPAWNANTEPDLAGHQLRQMDAAGIEDIQNHSINHPSLGTIPRDQVVEQLSLCNLAISRHLGGKIARHHADPSGSYSSTVIEVLAELGFRTATTVESRAAIRTDNLLALPRYGIVPSTLIGTFKTWIGYTDPPPPLLPYRFTGTVGTGWGQPSYGEVDSNGRLWVCEYSPGRLRIFEPDGAEAAFSPITQGQTQSGTTRSLETSASLKKWDSTL